MEENKGICFENEFLNSEIDKTLNDDYQTLRAVNTDNKSSNKKLSKRIKRLREMDCVICQW